MGRGEARDARSQNRGEKICTQKDVAPQSLIEDRASLKKKDQKQRRKNSNQGNTDIRCLSDGRPARTGRGTGQLIDAGRAEDSARRILGGETRGRQPAVSK